MGKSTISMAIFNSYVKLPEGTWSNKYNSIITILKVIINYNDYKINIMNNRP